MNQTNVVHKRFTWDDLDALFVPMGGFSQALAVLSVATGAEIPADFEKAINDYVAKRAPFSIALIAGDAPKSIDYSPDSVAFVLTVAK